MNLVHAAAAQEASRYAEPTAQERKWQRAYIASSISVGLSLSAENSTKPPDYKDAIGGPPLLMRMPREGCASALEETHVPPAPAEPQPSKHDASSERFLAGAPDRSRGGAPPTHEQPGAGSLRRQATNVEWNRSAVLDYDEPDTPPRGGGGCLCFGGPPRPPPQRDEPVAAPRGPVRPTVAGGVDLRRKAPPAQASSLVQGMPMRTPREQALDDDGARAAAKQRGVADDAKARGGGRLKWRKGGDDSAEAKGARPSPRGRPVRERAVAPKRGKSNVKITPLPLADNGL